VDKGYKRPTKRSRELRANMTDAERKLWAYLSARKVAGVRFNTQFPIGGFVCDFVSRGAKLVIEVDGGQHAEAEQADAERTRFIERRGYRVIRFWNNDVLGNVEGVVGEIERVLGEMGAQQNRPSPNPAPGERCPASFRPCRGHGRPGARKREGN
jgi:very-short-patch-repair endonuclease